MRYLTLLLSLIVFLTGAEARADTVTRCPQGSFGVYYVLPTEQASVPLLVFSLAYTATGLAEPRRFDELAHSRTDLPVFYAMCSNDVAGFETSKGIYTGKTVAKVRGSSSELFQVLDVNDRLVGTVWRDEFEPFDQGGAVGGQSYWGCGTALTPVVLNFGGFSSGLDTSAMNNTSTENAERHFLGHIRSKFLQDVAAGMAVEQCVQLPSKADFVGLPGVPEVWYRVFDTSNGAGDTR